MRALNSAIASLRRHNNLQARTSYNSQVERLFLQLLDKTGQSLLWSLFQAYFVPDMYIRMLAMFRELLTKADKEIGY